MQITGLLDNEWWWVGGAKMDSVFGGSAAGHPAQDGGRSGYRVAVGRQWAARRVQLRRLQHRHRLREVGFDEVDAGGGRRAYGVGIKEGENFGDKSFAFGCRAEIWVRRIRAP